MRPCEGQEVGLEEAGHPPPPLLQPQSGLWEMASQGLPGHHRGTFCPSLILIYTCSDPENQRDPRFESSYYIQIGLNWICVASVRTLTMWTEDPGSWEWGDGTPSV